MPTGAGTSADAALRALLNWLGGRGYRFITPTPLTHRRVFARRRASARGTLADVFGWNLPFGKTQLAEDVLELMRAAEILREENGVYRSDVRVSSIDDTLFLHSGFPTDDTAAVFFGPDTYRFVAFLRQQLACLPQGPAARWLDVGCGSGAGGIMAARGGGPAQLFMTDINPLALRYAAINAAAAGVPVQFGRGDALAAAPGDFDMICCNPPYLQDAGRRAYRHGGDRLGRALGLRIAGEALSRLAPGGSLLLYTGVAIVDGKDGFIEELMPALAAAGCDWDYREIDPDVFGEELEHAPYLETDRIAAVGLVARKR